MIPGIGAAIGGFEQAAGAPPAAPITYIGRSQAAASGGTVTYASAPLSAPAADRLVVVVITGESVGNYTTTGVSVGGTALTRWSPGRIQLFTAIVSYFEIYYGIVASGSAPNIVMTTTAERASMDVYCCSGLSATPVDQVSKTSASGTSCAINDVETKVGGALIAGIAAQGTGASVTESWTGTDSVVEDSDQSASMTNTSTAAAHIATTVAATTDDFTFTLSASKTFVGGAISFGP
ncbi:hypothetical protein EFV37_13150 [Mesorhizobium loti]|uniref:Uncharacterized protein n=1 Tax=Mesorhizobium jarvisii TaxID=1777867 RepID=A0A6M7TEM4_9HYPH|nr:MULTISPECIES: hypothetical protein [Mesorhizobium]OBQ58030.1 hypothetical protein A9K72_27890 [Mesorhizobium loti]QKC63142.1 hypothetical protein EB229_13140 [Mesorhizobium jarvisii]QKD09053.1 hypothetical protein EFV37_13150 [Mesorhizobium loti]RJT30149.1 hypothetical protein D3242_25875 [Mesorhizobium jarvisii]